jgi:NAD(P)H-hydrate epimerase
MYYLNAATIRKLDAVTIENGTPGRTLMERAGYGAYLFLSRIAAPKAGRFLVVAGKGNNAGDALVIVRYLLQQGKSISILALSDPEQYTGDALLNWKRLYELCPDITVATDIEKLQHYFADWHGDVIVDGLLGTGIRGEVAGLYAAAIDCINTHPSPVLALDIPSGLHCDTGKPCGCAVKANWTVTFAHPKRSMITKTGADHCGRVEVIDIGIDYDIGGRIIRENEDAPLFTCLSSAEAGRMLPERDLRQYKNVFGHLLVLAGSRGMTGAAVLTALSALKSGTGLVTPAIPESLLELVAPVMPSVMTLPLPDNGTGALTPDVMPVLENHRQKFSAVAIGPGIGLSEPVHAFVKVFLESCSAPLVIDADALNCIASTPGFINALHNKEAVLTPHPGEFARLRNSKPGNTISARIESAQSFAEVHDLTILLKGYQTIIATRDEDLYINPTGNPGMATAGSGDVLTGIIGALLAQQLRPHDAAVLGAYVHGLAGDIAAAEQGHIAMTSSDIIQMLGKAFGWLTHQ